METTIMFYRKGEARSKRILDFLGTAGRVYGFQALVHRGFESLDLRGSTGVKRQHMHHKDGYFFFRIL